MNKYKVFDFEDFIGIKYSFVRLATEGLRYPPRDDNTCFVSKEMAEDYCAVLNYGAGLREMKREEASDSVEEKPDR